MNADVMCKKISLLLYMNKEIKEGGTFMDTQLEAENALIINNDDLAEGTVISIEGATVFVDIPPFGTGIIFGREFMIARDMIKNLNIGDTVKGKVIVTENKDGYIELSLKEARQAVIWTEAEKIMREKSVLSLVIKDANKGGLIIEWQGINGFLPASQLKTDHYPRVNDGNREDIIKELKKLVGQSLSVAIISTLPKEGKLIFSEKGQETKERKEAITRYTVGEEIDCEVTGIVDFGLFLKIEDGLEGLVHISELDWRLVDDPRKFFSVGQKVKAKIIGVSDEKISLSIKALTPNPWVVASNKYKKDDLVSGVVIKFNKHGALIAIEEGVSGLIHVSEFESEADLKKKLELGKSYQFKINVFDPKEQKMTLLLNA